MAFSRVKASGWAFLEVLTSAQMNSLDIDHANSVDGAAGGQYTPSAQLDFRGDGGGNDSAINLQNPPTIDATPVVKVQSLAPVYTGVPDTTTTFADSWLWDSGAMAWIQADQPAHLLQIPFSDIVDKSTLTKIRAYVGGALGNSGAWSVLPSTPAEAELWYTDSSGVLQTPAPQNVQDPSGTVGAFNAVHAIEVTLSTPLAINQESSPVALYLNLTGPDHGTHEPNKFGLVRLEAEFSATRIWP